MSDIELVIKIPSAVYEQICKKKAWGEYLDGNESVIASGIPLPKGHGRLIDAGKFVDVLNNAQIEGLNTYKGLGRAKELLTETHTIIEADKESEE